MNRYFDLAPRTTVSAAVTYAGSPTGYSASFGETVKVNAAAHRVAIELPEIKGGNRGEEISVVSNFSGDVDLMPYGAQTVAGLARADQPGFDNSSPGAVLVSDGIGTWLIKSFA